MTRSIFDPKLAITFAAIIREGSISAAARALDVAQPWVSEQMRKLELQLGERLLIRTSRRIELTDAGRAFLEVAEALSQANDAAQHLAAEMRMNADRQVRIGATDFTIGREERIMLIDSFLQRNPRAELQILGGKPADLIQQLAAGDLDIAMVHLQGVAERADLVHVGLGPSYAHVLVPPGDPLFDAETVPISAFAGRKIIVSPGRTDAPTRRVSLAPLEPYGVQLIAAPDEDRAAIATFAARQRHLCFWWYREDHPRHMRGSQACIPLIGNPLQNELAVFRRRSDVRGKIMRFWSAAEHLLDGVAAG